MRDDWGSHIDKRILQAAGVTDSNLFSEEDQGYIGPYADDRLTDYDAFSVEGYLDGTPYWVAVFFGGQPGSTVEIRGADAVSIRTVLASHVGTSFALPSGATRLLDLTDPASILAALNHLTQVVTRNGRKPPGYALRGPDLPVHDA